MLSSEFSNEMGALIRSLESKVRQEPGLMTTGNSQAFTTDHLERAIISLIAVYLDLKRADK